MLPEVNLGITNRSHEFGEILISCILVRVLMMYLNMLKWFVELPSDSNVTFLAIICDPQTT